MVSKLCVRNSAAYFGTKTGASFSIKKLGSEFETCISIIKFHAVQINHPRMDWIFFRLNLASIAFALQKCSLNVQVLRLTYSCSIWKSKKRGREKRDAVRLN